MGFPSTDRYAREWVVNGKIWTLKFASSIVYGGGPNWGVTDPSAQEIILCSRISRANIFSTFWHELDHAIEFSFEIDDHSKKKKFDSHRWIYMMEEYRARTMADNWEKLRKLFK
jgi:hypothetical protein